MVSFLPDTVYGTRSAYHEVLLVTSNDRHNNAQKSKLCKSGMVSGVSMLQRNEMLKPQRDGFGAESKFTRVQEMKQARVCWGK